MSKAMPLRSVGRRHPFLRRLDLVSVATSRWCQKPGACSETDLRKGVERTLAACCIAWVVLGVWTVAALFTRSAGCPWAWWLGNTILLNVMGWFIFGSSAKPLEQNQYIFIEILTKPDMLDEVARWASICPDFDRRHLRALLRTSEKDQIHTHQEYRGHNARELLGGAIAQRMDHIDLVKRTAQAPAGAQRMARL